MASVTCVCGKSLIYFLTLRAVEEINPTCSGVLRAVKMRKG